MLLDFQRAFTPQEMGEWECGLCRRDFRVESVIATAETHDGQEIGRICRGCIEHFGQVNPEVFPTIEEYQAFIERYPEPIWDTQEEADRAEDAADFDYGSTFVWRSPA